MSNRAVQPAPEPVDEPILVTLPDGSTCVVEPGTQEWLIAWAWREKEAELKLAEGDLRGKRALIRKLQDDQDAKRKAYGKRDLVDRLFTRWQKLSGHTRSILGPERFDPTRARLEQGYTEEQLTLAVAGIALRPYVTDNGERQDEYEIAVRSGKQVERYANRCPADVRQQLLAELRSDKGDQMELGGG